MMTATEVIDAARQFGVAVAVAGDKLQLRAPQAPPREIMEAIRAHKPQIIDLLTRKSGTVARWTEGIDRLDPDRHPEGFPPIRWERLITDARVFLETWGAQADRLGWTDTAIFGVDPNGPHARIDKAGLVVLLDGGRVVAMSEDRAALMTRKGGRLAFYRQRHAELGAVAVWEVRT
jgi:hypothetical protein